ncbi:AbrB/MazE/SpoVT family DNA-binding domain-containing protein [Nostoc sp. ChiQUE01b]|uniref:AbrB/MazE/SpoVT family DNA-binding domain-containing protein n=1 Tax=Nostoc sp. ChiQUE01b TaxID=3075376 RepID=UPI002AD5B4BB|nr:AbrB/MazE/SpoVT family DNA-binding domain-containing protein [Nostoc sp. ChiQUE01b]MDZ8260576.1 AbrB/MazE/SpoVT family DNA-binding domain-containing protein [Nostoc sp. ChiQUE01b]
MEYKVDVLSGGRITLPASLRKNLHIAEGDTITISEENGEVKILSQFQKLEMVHNLVRSLSAGDRSSWSEELIASRREEFSREEQSGS